MILQDSGDPTNASSYRSLTMLGDALQIASKRCQETASPQLLLCCTLKGFLTTYTGITSLVNYSDTRYQSTWPTPSPVRRLFYECGMGCSQGSVSGLTSWNIEYNKILETLSANQMNWVMKPCCSSQQTPFKIMALERRSKNQNNVNYRKKKILFSCFVSKKKLFLIDKGVSSEDTFAFGRYQNRLLRHIAFLIHILRKFLRICGEFNIISH